MKAPKGLGIIPARGGSKSIPKKNMALLMGKPLLFYTFEGVRGCRTIDRFILSTDDSEIAAFGEKHGIDVPGLRPSYLAKDDTPMVDVVKHSLFLLEKEGYSPDYIVLLQPTSPLRSSKHIDEAVDIFLDNPGIDSVVSVIPVPHLFHPQLALRIEQGKLVPFAESVRLFARRQDKPPCFARNGPVVAVFKPSTVFRFNNIYGENSMPYIMSEQDSIDIDTPFDLKLAEAIIMIRKGMI